MFRKLILGCVSVCGLLSSSAQAPNDPMRQKFAELSAIKDTAVLNHRLRTLSASNIETDLLLAHSYYLSVKDTEMAQRLLKIGVEKFPKGEFVYSGMIMKMIGERNPDTLEAWVNALKIDFPDKPVSPIISSRLVTGFAEVGNKAKMWQYLDDLAAESDKSMYLSVLLQIAEIDPAKTAPLIKPLVDSMETRLKSLGVSGNSTENPAEHRRLVTYVNWGINAYTSALIKSGKGKDAYDYISVRYKNGDQKALATVYLKSLIASGRLKEAFPLIEEAWKSDAASADVKAKYRDAYIAVYGSEKGFENRKNKLLNEIEEKVTADAMKHAIREPAKYFTLKDTEGKTVSLNDYKGKVVVLDFWATWCGPCKASFPSMQLAVNKYKNDTTVKFLFIHTWEKGGDDPVKAAHDYVKNNNYSSRVLMDLRDPASKESKVAALYKVTGIPTKVIIDPAGNIRFNVSGFGGSPENAAAELSAMIEQARKAS